MCCLGIRRTEGITNLSNGARELNTNFTNLGDRDGPDSDGYYDSFSAVVGNYDDGFFIFGDNDLFSREFAGIKGLTVADLSGFDVVAHGGFTGVLTNPGDVPVTGTAQYTGDAAGYILVPGTAANLNNGQAVVDLDFANASNGATITLDSFDVDFIATHTGVNVPDTIVVSGASINGGDATLSGGSLTFFEGGSPVANPVLDVFSVIPFTEGVDGYLYGLNSVTNQPTSVGGLVSTTGSGGSEIEVLFVAD